jgi:hypothetical protein
MEAGSTVPNFAIISASSCRAKATWSQAERWGARVLCFCLRLSNVGLSGVLALRWCRSSVRGGRLGVGGGVSVGAGRHETGRLAGSLQSLGD